MRFGYSFGLAASATAGDVRAIADDVEAAGLDSLWVSDHVLIPQMWRFAPDDRTANRFGDRYRLEALTVLAHLAATTQRLVLGTSVVIAAQRETHLFAKQAATIDLLTGGGRLRLGIGAGWCAAEFEQLGASFARRGRTTDQLIADCRQLWSGRGGSEGLAFAPLTAPDTIPILIGGSSDRAIDRAVRLGDGWMPASAFETASVESFAALERRFRRVLDAHGRPRAEVPITLKVHLDPDGSDPGAALRGDPPQIADTVARYRALGVDELIIDLKVPPAADEARRTIARFAEQVVPLL